MPSEVEVIDKVIEYDGFFRLERVRLRHERFAGGMSSVLGREVVTHSDIVAVLPHDPGLDQVVLVEQFRVGAHLAKERAWLYETVAGMIDAGESPEAAAVRETREEIGTGIVDLACIGTYFLAPHQSPDRMHLFFGRVDSTRVTDFGGLAHEGEDIRVVRMPRQDAIAAALSGRIRSPWTAIALLRLGARA